MEPVKYRSYRHIWKDLKKHSYFIPSLLELVAAYESGACWSSLRMPMESETHSQLMQSDVRLLLNDRDRASQREHYLFILTHVFINILRSDF